MIKRGLVVCFIFSLILLLGVTSALSCSITTSCNSANRLMAVSSSTNAHGEVYDASNYAYYVCCDETVNHGCDGSNKVLGLSSSTNAHAEIPSLSNYATSVCLEGYSCVGRTSCLSGETAVMSISSSTNAHIGGASDYSTKICCAATINPDPFWSSDGSSAITQKLGVVPGSDSVIMVLEDSGYSSGTAVNFNIYEYDALNSDDFIRTISGTTDATGKVTATWTITQTDIDNGDDGVLEGEPYEYYFQILDSLSNTQESPKLSLTTGSACELSSASWSRTSALEGQEVQLNVVGGSLCDGETVSFEIKEDDTAGDDDVETNPVDVTFSGASATGTWIAEWQEDGCETCDPEYYFTATVSGVGSVTSVDPELTVVQSSVACVGISQCRNYDNEEDCEMDLCQAGITSVEDNNPDLTCGTEYNALMECNENVDCGCTWNSTASVCGPVYNFSTSGCTGEDPNIKIGTCTYNENSADNCDDGILTYSWEAGWGWSPENQFSSNPDGDKYVEDQGYWRYDPKDSSGIRRSAKCASGENSVACPAQVQLPLNTNVYTVLIIIAIVVLGYLLLSKKQGRKKSKKVAKRKKR